MAFNPRFNSAPFELVNNTQDYSTMLQQGLGGIGDQLQKNRDYAAGLAETKARLGLGREALDYRKSQDEIGNKLAQDTFDLNKRKEDWDELHPTGSTNPPMWLPNPDPNAPPGSVIPASGSPGDPNYAKLMAIAKSRTPGTKPLTAAYSAVVKEAGGDLYNLTYANNTFKDEYGGHYVAGNLGFDLAKKGFGSEEMAKGSDWWSQYNGNVQAIKRNRLYGAALTDNERADFNRSDINPTMDPARIKANLKRQHEILVQGATRLSGQLLAGGTDPTVVEQQLGIRLDDLGFKIKRDKGTNKVTEITEYPYIEGMSDIGVGGSDVTDLGG